MKVLTKETHIDVSFDIRKDLQQWMNSMSLGRRGEQFTEQDREQNIFTFDDLLEDEGHYSSNSGLEFNSRRTTVDKPDVSLPRRDNYHDPSSKVGMPGGPRTAHPVSPRISVILRNGEWSHTTPA
ncbi:hypothetical protein BU17DRAFT_69420 [Hysterangium stoloniferum]|nr:hypothetical protein BU17DRAFT_69420 [Hysterangium stoloniferum]